MKINEVLENMPNLLESEKKMNSLFSDFYTNDKARINRMMLAYKEGIFQSILNEKNTEFDKNSIINRMVSFHDMREDKAKEAVNDWYLIIDNKVISAYKKYQKEKELKNQVENDIACKRNEKSNKDKTNLQFKSLSVENRNINPVLIDNVDITIPCGVGNNDFGFKIIGINKCENCKHKYSDVFAIIYNYLLRNSHISRDDYPTYFKEKEFLYEIDYRNVFQYEIIFLQMIKNNYLENNSLLLNTCDVEEADIAIKIINNYISLFCRLMNREPVHISLKKGKTKISLGKKSDIYTSDLEKVYSVARDIWIGKKINYKLNNNHRKDLEYLLHEISPFKSFKEGQYSALCSMMNARNHAVCIMPTGSGKSLIYYFASILQPQSILVISPTDILIRDQIRNLRKYHHYDNVAHMQLRTDYNFSNFNIYNNIIYMTPMTFQNRNLFSKLIFNRVYGVAYVVLDEIHCLSNWGHDFRPEYLMLSKNLKKHLDRTTYLGFTATANYSVVEDIQKQLDIPIENFFSPIAFEKVGRYDFRCVSNEKAMLNEVKKIANSIARLNERAIVFTKSDEISIKVANAIGYEADVFTKDRPESYQQFTDGFCKILVTNEELGIGINFPDVNATIHYGIPVSKNEYVQEIGRAGRETGRLMSYIVYLEPSVDNINPTLLKRDTIINNLSQTLNSMNNDYSDAYHKMNDNADTSGVLFDQLKDIYSDLRIDGHGIYNVTYTESIAEEMKKYLYMLYVTGYINDWYSYKADTEKHTIDILIDINYTDWNTYRFEENVVERMRKRTIEYLNFMGNDRKSISKISRAEKIDDILKVYVDWYYENYLYHHKEQFLDFFEFLQLNQDCDAEKITDEISEYFVLPFIEIKADEDYYLNLPFEELTDKAVSGIGKNTLANIERINSNNYSYKLDFVLFISNWRRYGNLDVNRLERFWNRLSKHEKNCVLKALYEVYSDCNIDAKWNFLNYIDDKNNIMQVKLDKILDELYLGKKKDQIFYGIMAKKANEKFNEFYGGKKC